MNSFQIIVFVSLILNLVLVSATLADDSIRSAETDDNHRRLHEIFDEHDQWRLSEHPEVAMRRGDFSNADRITDNSLAAIERRHEKQKSFLARLGEIDQQRLSKADRLNYDLFRTILHRGLVGHRYRVYLAPIGGRYGPQTRIPRMHEIARFQTLEDFENYVTRLLLVPQSIRSSIEAMRIGMREGRTPPGITLRGLPDQFEALHNGGLDDLSEPFASCPSHLDVARFERIKAKFETSALPTVRAAIAELGHFVSNEYLPACRVSIAASDWPNGEAWYRHQLHSFTSTTMSAKDIHELGLSEVARIRAEMMQVIRHTDFLDRLPDASGLDDDALFDRFIDFLRSDPMFYHTSDRELLMGYRDICKQADAWLPVLFGRLPRLTYGVRAVPDFIAPHTTTAYYMPGSLAAGRPGNFVANTYALDQRPKYEMIPLALHEAVPGHHLQIAIAQELEDLPEFRKDAHFTAYSEGWALYTERLGIEMGFYTDPYNDFGRLLYEMWRACRLVVDPGIHAIGWSRQQAIDFMLANSALSELNVINEVDRYIAWPGQATAYKIGELKIRKLRERAEQTLGDAFNIRAFHDCVLEEGALPLDILERRVNEWIDAQLPTTP